MNTYIALLNFTPQGLQNVHESPRRAGAFKAAAKKAGVKVRELYWTLGACDGVIIFEAQDEAAAAGALLALAAQGNVQTQTLRAFEAAQFAAIVANSPRL